MNRSEMMKEIEELVVDISLMINHEFSTEYDNKLSSNQQLLLFLIGKKGVKYVKDLAYYLNVSASAVSQMVAKLEQMDMVARDIDPANRRNTILKLGPDGEHLLKLMVEKRELIFSKYLSKMKLEDLSNLQHSYKQFRDIILAERKKEERRETD
ncbi:MarR family transcriptional regulator [Evansella halocellulosilytica]|uniref:MarR family transcriptional regulator n=1 Tax=Evansella halocellulosilytica TaxID=2011013 RepID=UPI000BB6C798|nr:MarR family transcriptional regulator [Evansella halocellulosilytica]